MSPIFLLFWVKKLGSTTHSFWFLGKVPSINTGLFKSSMHITFVTISLFSISIFPSASNVPSTCSIFSIFASSSTSLLVNPNVDITCISYTF